MDNKDIILQPARKRTIAEAISFDYNFDIGDIITAAFRTTKGFKLKFFLAFLVYMAILLVLSLIGELLFGEKENILYEILINILSYMMAAGFVAMGLNWLRGSNTKVVEVFSGFKIPLSILLATIAISILIIIGIILLIIPGIYLIISYTLVYYIILDNPNIKIWDAMETSRKIIHKRWFKVFALNLIFGLIFFATTIPFFIALFWFIVSMQDANMIISGLTLLASLIPLVISLIWVFPAYILANCLIYQTIFDINNTENLNKVINTDDGYNQNINY